VPPRPLLRLQQRRQAGQELVAAHPSGPHRSRRGPGGLAHGGLHVLALHHPAKGARLVRPLLRLRQQWQAGFMCSTAGRQGLFFPAEARAPVHSSKAGLPITSPHSRHVRQAGRPIREAAPPAIRAPQPASPVLSAPPVQSPCCQNRCQS
jgi:hypothetical protein